MRPASDRSPAMARSRNKAAARAMRSRANRPTTCTPSGRPAASTSSGTLMQGGPSSVHSRLKVGSAGRAEAVRSGARRRRREDHVGVGHQLGEHLARAARDAAGLVVGVGLDRGGLVELLAQDRPESLAMMVELVGERAEGLVVLDGAVSAAWRPRRSAAGRPPGRCAPAACGERALRRSTAACMSALASAHRCVRTSAIAAASARAVDAQIAPRDGGGREGHVRHAGREHARRCRATRRSISCRRSASAGTTA